VYATEPVFELIGPDYLDMFQEQGAGERGAQLREILDRLPPAEWLTTLPRMLHWMR